MKLFQSKKGDVPSSLSGLLTKGVLMIILYLILTNVVLFSSQTMIVLMIGIGIWILLKV
jgi:hypothetical protein